MNLWAIALHNINSTVTAVPTQLVVHSLLLLRLTLTQYFSLFSSKSVPLFVTVGSSI